jgi:hypothetical protein
MCYDKSNVIDYCLQTNIYGRGESILSLDNGIISIRKLNKEYPTIYHNLRYDPTNGLYFIEWKSKDKNSNNILIKI